MVDEYAREPCPWRIVDDCGAAFAMGCVGGGVFQSIKGFSTAPSGMAKRFQGSVMAVKQRAPILAGSFAVWGGTFSLIDCTLIQIRKKVE